MEKPQRKKKDHKKKALTKVFVLPIKHMTVKYLHSQSLHTTERTNKLEELKETLRSPELCILISPFPSLFVLLSRQVGHERNTSINTVPPSFTALPCPPTRGHKPAFNTRVYPNLPQTSAGELKQKSVNHTPHGEENKRLAMLRLVVFLWFIYLNPPKILQGLHYFYLLDI